MAQDMRALRQYVTAMDGHQYDNVPETVVCLLITHSNLKLQMVDIRLDLHSTIGELRHKLYQHTGSKPDAMELLIMRSDGSVHAHLEDDNKMLGFYNVENGLRLHIVDKDPYSLSRRGGLEDVSLVKKYEMSEEDYNKREKTVRAYKKEQLAKDPNWKPKTMMNVSHTAADPITRPGPESVANMKVGDRCEVQPGGRLGQVQYLGEVSEIAPGYWVGVQFDEPVGKSDGSVKGKAYFRCQQKYGGFVRPHNVTNGEFPVLDPFADLSDSDDNEL
ncbi:Alpha-tubulin folding cofactor B [Plasmopara halstedii]|uniref:Alpha-tubulin folding cofactor B n=1 Tax=Plasmopara halstedii TaxID=4781 RepID=A0A0P1AY02_PLAHL|nr:Alpha-tubulin folding cofactor B [Plasmopara halstedii]CEG45679.1 Alpha-tubulin folding cofactor B [Plasmopara halstedii]|eukprot:XP_024582048.1 Alpha-tubulin folding cofactor B [Plasmopara halstedii]